MTTHEAETNQPTQRRKKMRIAIPLAALTGVAALATLGAIATRTEVAGESDFVCAKNGKAYQGYSHKSWQGEYTGMTLIYNDDNLRVPFAVNSEDLKEFVCVPAVGGEDAQIENLKGTVEANQPNPDPADPALGQ